MFAGLIASGEDLVNPFGNCGYVTGLQEVVILDVLL